jgi:hypothetical protein
MDRFLAAQDDFDAYTANIQQVLLNETPEQLVQRRENAIVKLQALQRGRIGRRQAKKVHRAQLFSYTGMQSRRRFSTLYAECEEMDDETPQG